MANFIVKNATSFFKYDIKKKVYLKSKKTGVLNRLVQLMIMSYIIGFAIVWNKGYQVTDHVVSSASTTVKGVTYTNLSELQKPGISDRVWDPADLIIPPQENNAFFVMTNAIVTSQQTQGICTEDPSHTSAQCTTDADCPVGEYVKNGNGIRTGKCNTTAKMCLIRAWCPVEKADDFPLKNQPLLNNTDTFTVLIKNQVKFPKFGVKRRNMLDISHRNVMSDFGSCKYNETDEMDKFCPIFELGYMVNSAKENYTELASYGGLMLINIEWNCDLDQGPENCLPKYSFQRLDEEHYISKGWNFRYANFYYVNDTQYRDLIKAYGIRFIIEVYGEAGKFSVASLVMNLGNGMALLAIATVISDFVSLHILKEGRENKDKFEEGGDDDDDDGDDNQILYLSDGDTGQNCCSCSCFGNNYKPVGASIQIRNGGRNNMKRKRGKCCFGNDHWDDSEVDYLLTSA